MTTRKLKYFIDIWKWQPGVQHSGFTTPGEWTGPYTKRFMNLGARSSFLRRERQGLVDAKASDGHILYRLEFRPK